MFPWSKNLLNTSMSLLAYALKSGYIGFICVKKILETNDDQFIKNGLVAYNVMTILCQKTSIFRLLFELTHMVI